MNSIKYKPDANPREINLLHPWFSVYATIYSRPPYSRFSIDPFITSLFISLRVWMNWDWSISKFIYLIHLCTVVFNLRDSVTELTRVNQDRNIFSINVELTSTLFTLQRFGPSPSPNFKYICDVYSSFNKFL